jgi:electron transport complex protein RnfC
MRRLFHFRGGVRLKEHKKDTTAQPVQQARLPKRLVLPLQQHIGAPAKPVVAVGDTVLKGQLIARAASLISAPVHASSSGRVIAIDNHPIPHPSGLSIPCITIKTDGREQWRPRSDRIDDYHALSPMELREIIRDAGIVGLGGAGFPSHVKLNPDEHTIETLILNGAECEPYITCDEMLLQEHARDIIAGLHIMRYVLNAKRCIIGVENNKLPAFYALQAQVRKLGADFIEVVQVPTVYPTGGEKQLIQVLTGKEVPAGALPIDLGIVCHNVGTAYAVYRAVARDEPLISRYITIAGNIAHARNLEVLIGTPVIDLIEECGGDPQQLSQVIMGGPMMGVALPSVEVPAVKTTNCILVNSTLSDVPLPSRDRHAMPCIRCGQCADACPVNLLPQQLYWHARAKDFDKVQDYHLFDCIECGCCDYVCPSQIPLVQYYRFAKTEIWAQEQAKKLADLARERHQFHELRIEREKRERAERHKQKRAALKKGDDKSDTTATKKAAIEAAMARVRAKRETSIAQAKNTDNLTPGQQQLIAEADARRTREHTATPNEPAKKSEKDTVSS